MIERGGLCGDCAACKTRAVDHQSRPRVRFCGLLGYLRICAGLRKDEHEAKAELLELFDAATAASFCLEHGEYVYRDTYCTGCWRPRHDDH